MRSSSLTLVVVLLFLSCAVRQPWLGSEESVGVRYDAVWIPAEELTGRRQMDGDTAWFTVNGWTYKVRFEVYCPEDETPEGQAATAFTTAALTAAEQVELEWLDSYTWDRPVCRVFVDGEQLGALLVEAGYATWEAPDEE